MKKRLFIIGGFGLLLMSFALLVSCTGDQTDTTPPPADTVPAVAVVATDLTCTQCHDGTTLIDAKQAQAAVSKHQTGRGWFYAGPRAACTGCHSSAGFQERVATGIGPADGKDREDASPQECRTCHEIHDTYTRDDFALRTTQPVTLYVSGATFDKGKGNLCASCHQPRATFKAEGGIVKVTSTHYGPHYGNESTLLLGIGGALVPDSPSPHYAAVQDSCVTCHMPGQNHTLTLPAIPGAIKTCQTCHADLKNFDRNGVQTEVKALIKELEGLLQAKGMLSEVEHGPEDVVVEVDVFGRAVHEIEGPHPVVGEYPEEEAGALWNYRILSDDKSYGVHNPAYTKALLKASIDALK